MNYPELIYSEKPLPAVMNRQILTDLRLDSAFTPAVCETMLQKPEKATIALRREMFSRLISDPEAPAKIKKLYSCSMKRPGFIRLLRRTANPPYASFSSISS